MAYADRVQETTTTTGTGSLTLGGAVTDFQRFQDAFATGTRVNYAIQGGSDWEVGSGVLSAATTLTREVIFSSSNAGALVNLAAGTKNVFCDLPAVGVADIALTAKFASAHVNQ